MQPQRTNNRGTSSQPYSSRLELASVHCESVTRQRCPVRSRALRIKYLEAHAYRPMDHRIHPPTCHTALLPTHASSPASTPAHVLSPTRASSRPPAPATAPEPLVPPAPGPGEDSPAVPGDMGKHACVKGLDNAKRLAHSCTPLPPPPLLLRPLLLHLIPRAISYPTSQGRFDHLLSSAS